MLCGEQMFSLLFSLKRLWKKAIQHSVCHTRWIREELKIQKLASHIRLSMY